MKSIFYSIYVFVRTHIWGERPDPKPLTSYTATNTCGKCGADITQDRNIEGVAGVAGRDLWKSDNGVLCFGGQHTPLYTHSHV